MKKAMNQSKLMLLLNGSSIVALLLVVLLLFINSGASNRLQKANADKTNLTYNANLFVNGSSSLVQDVRAYAATGRSEHRKKPGTGPGRPSGNRHHLPGAGHDRPDVLFVQ